MGLDEHILKFVDKVIKMGEKGTPKIDTVEQRAKAQLELYKNSVDLEVLKSQVKEKEDKNKNTEWKENNDRNNN